jgi:hypothetical protein
MVRAPSRSELHVGGLLVAWLGAWGVWLAHPLAGLTQTALDLALVAQRLPNVVYGQLGSMPDVLRASIGLMAVALNLAAGGTTRRWLRWLLPVLALVLAVRLLPPYPQVLDLWRSPDYGRRFVVAALTLVGWIATLTGRRWPARWQAAVTLALGLAAFATGLWAFLALQGAFTTAMQLTFAPGWGLALYVAGLLLATVLSLLAFLKPLPLPGSEPA